MPVLRRHSTVLDDDGQAPTGSMTPPICAPALM
jgi:hypothetical protein